VAGSSFGSRVFVFKVDNSSSSGFNITTTPIIFDCMHGLPRSIAFSPKLDYQLFIIGNNGISMVDMRIRMTINIYSVKTTSKKVIRKGSAMKDEKISYEEVTLDDQEGDDETTDDNLPEAVNEDISEFFDNANTLASFSNDSKYLTILKMSKQKKRKTKEKYKSVVSVVEWKLPNQQEQIQGLVLKDQSVYIALISPYTYMVTKEQSIDQAKIESCKFISHYALLVVNTVEVCIHLMHKEQPSQITRTIQVNNITKTYMNARWLSEYVVLLLDDSGKIEYLKLSYKDLGFVF